ncbi:CaiB/BaiF CoA transferase family protein [Cryptosporangium sp. NPDC051539]|uniref:CaiB/BaiF CoA transferase family protein n=1 Tax=Cryptosporangium sp. NPDC051539 TaxID=3363962 RepID=UPI0037A13274
MTQSILDGLTVLEFGAGSTPAALAGVILADSGARVIKVEPPEGDRMRTAAPSGHLFYNRGKESLVADLRTAEGQEQARALTAAADVVISGFAPGTAERFGIGYDELRQLNPLLVHCAINGFGSEGPYAKIKAYEQVVQAKAGIFTLGYGGFYGYRPGPIYCNSSFASNGAGHLAASGILAALLVREQTGHGQSLEVPLYNGISPSDYYGTMTWLWDNGKVTLPSTPRADGDEPTRSAPSVVASRFSYMPCTKDGRFVYFTAMLPHQTRAVCRALGIEKILDEERFAKAPLFGSAEDAEAYEDAIWQVFRTKTYAEWDELLRNELDVAYELTRTSEEGLDHPQVRHNREVLTLQDPTVGPVEQVGPIAHFDVTPVAVTRSAPALGEHNGPLNGPSPVTPSGGSPEYPLAGFTVVEFGYFFAMPFATQTLAALGARVIKIEDQRGDPMRSAFGAPETGAARVMEGKESISVNLRTPEGRKVIHDLVSRADAFVNGFRSGIAERNGLDYDTLSALNPELVYLHATGYGVDGPSSTRPVFAQCAMSVAGAINRQAGFWMDPELTTGMSVNEAQVVIMPRLRAMVDGDSNAALACLSALTLALYHKRRTGKGQYLTTSMLGSNLWAYADDAIRYEGKPPLPAADPGLNGIQASYRLYQAAGGGWVFLAAPRQSEWERFAAAAGRPDLVTDDRFATPESRAANDEALVAELETLFAGRKAAEWEAAMVEQGVACVECFPETMSEFTATDPVLKETGLVTEVDHPLFGRILRHGLPVRFSETPGRLAAGCLCGEQTRSIMTELGYPASTIEDLASKEAVFTR